MTDTSMPAGWYHAEGDPAGTQRYWDGVTWQGEPQLTGAAPATATAATGPSVAAAQSGFGPFDWFLEPFKKYGDFSGRARRAEYWWFSLGLTLIAVVLTIVASLFDSGLGLVPLGLFMLATLIPSIAVSIRRLHDSGKSGWFYLLSLIPVISLILLVFMFLDSEKTPNKWGPSPKYG